MGLGGGGREGERVTQQRRCMMTLTPRNLQQYELCIRTHVHIIHVHTCTCIIMYIHS